MRLHIPASIALASALALLAGCESAPVAQTPAMAMVETRSTTPAAAQPATPANAGAVAAGQGTSSALASDATALQRAPGVGAGAAATASMAAPTQRLVFFDFDSYVIKSEFSGLIEGHAKALASNKSKRMVIEGHADERGGREYNLALGQKRAEAVVKSLALLGVTAPQLEAVSFGEERPLQQGSDESAWSRNRRAELKDR